MQRSRILGSEARAQLVGRGTPPDPRERARYARHTGRRLHLQTKCLELLMLACNH